jgi:hypothetical protein
VRQKSCNLKGLKWRLEARAVNPESARGLSLAGEEAGRGRSRHESSMGGC